jgi:hypothetical protein
MRALPVRFRCFDATSMAAIPRWSGPAAQHRDDQDVPASCSCRGRPAVESRHWSPASFHVPHGEGGQGSPSGPSSPSGRSPHRGIHLVGGPGDRSGLARARRGRPRPLLGPGGSITVRPGGPGAGRRRSGPAAGCPVAWSPPGWPGLDRSADAGLRSTSSVKSRKAGRDRTRPP